MINKTFGTGGDYADDVQAWAYASSLITLTDDITFTQVGNCTRTTGVSSNNRLYLGGYTCKFENPNRYVINISGSAAGSDYRQNGVGTTGSTFIFDGLIYNQTSNHNVVILQSSVWVTPTTTGLNVYFKNIKFFGNNNINATGIDFALWNVNYYVLNCVFYNLLTGLKSITTDADTYDGIHTVENCIAYSCTYGIQVTGNTGAGTTTSRRNVTFKNTISLGSVTEDWYNGSGTAAFNSIINCADSDNSIATSGAILNNNITGITTADFTSVISTDDDFLYIDKNSDLFSVGISDISAWNTTDISGNPRPNGGGGVSIGVYEPIVDLDPFSNIVHYPSTPFNFHESTLMVGDHNSALSISDRVSINDFNLEMVSGFDEVFDSEESWVEWGVVRPGVKFGFSVPRYLSNTFLDWQKNDTPLQAELRLIKNVNEHIYVQLPNFKIRCTLKSGAQTSIDVDCILGRNGYGNTLINNNMLFTSPINLSVASLLLVADFYWEITN